jgi:chaperonin GroEL
MDGSIVIDKVRNSDSPNFGLNADTGEYMDLVKAGIIDPVKVTRTALQNAASIASLMMTTEVLITDIPEKRDKMPAMPSPEY